MHHKAKYNYRIYNNNYIILEFLKNNLKIIFKWNATMHPTWGQRWRMNKQHYILMKHGMMFKSLNNGTTSGEAYILAHRIRSGEETTNIQKILFILTLTLHEHECHYWYWKSINRTNDFIYYLPLESMSNNRKALSSWQGDKQQFWKVPAGLRLKHITVLFQLGRSSC